jgi:DNA polymerase III subunit delta'
MQFASIPGLPDIKENLINAVKNNHLAHALLFYGPEGSANLTMALALSTYLFCENPGENDSCGQCSPCQRMSRLVLPDLNFAMPSITKSKKEEEKEEEDEDEKSDLLTNWRKFVLSNPYGSIHDFILFNGFEKKQLNISKGAAKKIIQTLSLKAFEGGYKIMMIWAPEYLHPNAANALLKILEEPQPKTIFILITSHPEQLLTTILSRTQKVLVRGFTDEEIQNHLIETGKADEATANQVSMIADGSMREAIRLVDQVEDHQVKQIREWFVDCFKSDFKSLFSKADSFHKESIEGQKSQLLAGMNVLREMLLVDANLNQLVRTRGEDLDFVTKINASVFKGEHIDTLYEAFNQAHYHLERNGNAKFIFTDLSMKISRLMAKIS